MQIISNLRSSLTYNTNERSSHAGKAGKHRFNINNTVCCRAQHVACSSLTSSFNQDIVKLVALEHEPFQGCNKVTLD